MSNESKGRTFGHINGVKVYKKFLKKADVAAEGVHNNQMGGIHGDQELGAFSICLSRGYEDNIDEGTTITYVGSGGRINGEQRDQSFDHPHNKALFVSCQTRRPVRVVRGVNDKSCYSPKKGYRYDGLYVVHEVTILSAAPRHITHENQATMQQGKNRCNMCTFKLRRIEEEGMGPIPIRNVLASKLSGIRKQVR